MRASSPPIAIYKAPLKGMDAREVKPEDAPNLLFNVDLSNRGYWKERPGVKVVVDYAVRLGGAVSILGLHSTRVNGRFYLIVIYGVQSSQQVFISILDEAGVEMFSGSPGNFPKVLRQEPFRLLGRYSFITAGRFVYFCNGIGKFWELELRGIVTPLIREVSLEEGNKPLVLSYISGSIKPSALSYFYEQVVVSGFKSDEEVSISSVSEPPDPDNPWPPKEVLSTEKTSVLIDPGCVFVAEPGLWRSYPIEDPSGFYWVYNEDVVATAGIGTTLLLFGQERLYAILGHGSRSPGPTRTKLAEVSLVGPQAICYFDKYVFFVAVDGCYITDGSSVRKVSYEMDPLWFRREDPQTTRYVGQQIQKTAYPFKINNLALNRTTCITDRMRQQVMVSLPANDAYTNNMVWVFNYADMLEGIGPGKWSIWAGNEEPTFTGTALSTSAFPTNPSAPTQSNTVSNLFHWTTNTSDYFEGNQRIFTGTDTGKILEFGVTEQDYTVYPVWNGAGVRTTPPTVVPFPVAVSLGRIGRVDSDGRIVCTDVAVRRKQLTKNNADESTVAKLITVVRSEGEGLKFLDTSETDVEFEDTILNAQQGVSEKTNSTLNTMLLGAAPTGSGAPLIASEYFEAYARVNVPDEEGRAAYVDLYCLPESGPHRLHISEIRVHAIIKGGSQREQS
jgi:hypothetical protein